MAHVGFLIRANGTDVSQNFQDRLLGLSVVDNAEETADTAEIRLDDRNGAIDIPPTGAILDIALGYSGALIELGSFAVDEIRGEIAPQTLTIAAKGANMTGTLAARKTRAWKTTTVGDILSRIAAEHGLAPRVSDALSAISIDYLAQTSESDLNLLGRLARDLGALFKPTARHLIFAERNATTSTTGQPLPVPVIDLGDIASGAWELTSRGSYGRVSASFRDLGAGRKETVTVGDQDPELVLRNTYAREEDAQRAAQAALDRGRRAGSSLSLQLGEFRGDLVAGAQVSLSGLKSGLDGTWFLSRVEHRLDRELTTQLNAERSKTEDA